MALLRSRLFLWLVLALPGASMIWRWWATPELYGYGHIIGDSGDWAAWLLMVTLAVTPIRLLLRRSPVTQWLMRRRRDLGVASFGYAAFHTVVYLWRKADPAIIWDEVSTPYILAGWAALALFLPLAITSNDASMRRFKRSWKRLHRLVYPAAVLVFVHWASSAFDPTTAYINIAILAVIEIVRVAIQWRQRRTLRA
ncbi:protein-methionine-sulfoxide reductase heme-binding subunit MsrQ [Pseudoblastomonas halimionae]|uniref:Sulfite oxidase subunit YedZ n=1 Tax=Alteriqipengyuania halimionae TaxID=1926630 RepID=A0A6I4TYA9_9SPHN|nr:ferric reductase-like transmembrane domain-containing protein [Alteriqipengyuania halimionae]MXP08789.1 sulfite oxidase subunit YedZ [Alteriqipengyuania halimionae]